MSVSTPPAAMASDELLIEAGKTERNYWRDLLRYRELFLVLAWRDISVRYKQTVLGVAWALIQPFTTMIVFTIIFGNLAKMPSGDAPYPILVYTAMLPWQFFATSLSNCSNSLVSNANMISKVYFPRLLLPCATIAVSFVDFLISFALLLVIMLWFGFVPAWQIVLVPLLLPIVWAASLGVGLLLATFNEKYRDFRYVVPFILQVGLFLSPVGFRSDVVPEQWRLLYSLNPMVGVIDGFRAAILGGDSTVYWPGFALSLSVTILVLVGAISFFRRTERRFADVI